MDGLKKYIAGRRTGTFLGFGFFLLAIIIVLGYFASVSETEIVSKEITDSMIGRCGAVSEYIRTAPTDDREEMCRAIAGIMAVEPTTAEIEAGEEIMNGYGYHGQMNQRLTESYYSIFNRQSVFFCFAIFVCSAFFICISGAFIGIMKSEIRSITFLIRKASDNSDFPKENRYSGDIGGLYTAISMLNERVYRLLDTMHKDKIYLKEFISDISHQMKTPVAVLRMNNEIMQNEPDMPCEKRMEFIRRNEIQLDRIEWLVSGQLKLAKVEADVVEFDMRSDSLRQTVSLALMSFEGLSAKKEVTIRNEVPKELMLCHDSNWLAEAISNVVKNALEHSRSGGKITVSSEETPLTTTLIIKDNGMGIEKNVLPHIFERFYSKSPGTDTNSVGIGLSLSKGIFEKHGGQVTAKSTVGKGTEISIVFLKK